MSTSGNPHREGAIFAVGLYLGFGHGPYTREQLEVIQGCMERERKQVEELEERARKWKLPPIDG